MWVSGQLLSVRSFGCGKSLIPFWMDAIGGSVDPVKVDVADKLRADMGQERSGPTVGGTRECADHAEAEGRKAIIKYRTGRFASIAVAPKLFMYYSDQLGDTTLTSEPG